MKYLHSVVYALGVLLLAGIITVGVLGTKHLLADHEAYHLALEPTEKNFQLLELIRLEVVKQHDLSPEVENVP